MTINFYSGSDYEGLINFSTAVADAPFASALLAKLEQEYEDIDTAVDDLLGAFENAGFDVGEEDILALLTEEIPVSAEALEVLSGLYVDADGDLEDESGLERLLNAAVASHESFLSDEDEEEYEVEDEDEDDYEDEDLEDLDAEYEDLDEDEYEDYEDEGDEEFSHAYQKVLEFNRDQEVKNSLEDLMEYGASLVEQGSLAPIAFQMMFGTEDRTRLMNFSQASAQREIDDSTHLEAISYALDLFSSVGRLAERSGYRSPLNFSSVSLDDITDEGHSDTDQLAEGIFAAYRASRPF